MQATANHTVDLVLALLLALGSTIGAQVGARISGVLRGEQLMILLAMLALAVMAKMSVGLVVTPANLLEVGHGAEIKSEASPGARTVRQLPLRALHLSAEALDPAGMPRPGAADVRSAPRSLAASCRMALMASGGTASNVLWGGPS